MAGKRGLLGGLLGAVPFLCFSIESGCSQHCSQQSPQQSPFSRHSSQHSRGTFGDLGFLSPVGGGRDSYPRSFWNYRRKPKGDGGKGREKKCHDNLRQTSRQFTTCHDNLRHFMTISVSSSIDINVIKRHKIRHKMSRQFATLYDNL